MKREDPLVLPYDNTDDGKMPSTHGSTVFMKRIFCRGGAEAPPFLTTLNSFLISSSSNTPNFLPPSPNNKLPLYPPAV